MRSAALAVAALLAAGSGARAQEAVAVLSASAGSYQAAYDGFAEGFGRSVPSFRLPGETPATGSDTRVVVAFGSDAAVRRYPDHATLVVCLAPGLPGSDVHGGPFVLLDMKPPAEDLLGKLRVLQPRLARLGVLWNSDDTRAYLKTLKRAAPALGVQVTELHVADPADVPDVLRAQVGKLDALWLAPDPRLVTPQTFQTVKQFSWDNAIPFYAPTSGLAAAGAAAAVSVGPRELGRQAAALAKRALAGESLPRIVYPEHAELIVNLKSAEKAGLQVDAAALGPGAQVIK